MTPLREISDPGSDDRLRTQLIGRALAGVFWLTILLLACASTSVFSA